AATAALHDADGNPEEGCNGECFPPDTAVPKLAALLALWKGRRQRQSRHGANFYLVGRLVGLPEWYMTTREQKKRSRQTAPTTIKMMAQTGRNLDERLALVMEGDVVVEELLDEEPDFVEEDEEEPGLDGDEDESPELPLLPPLVVLVVLPLLPPLLPPRPPP